MKRKRLKCHPAAFDIEYIREEFRNGIAPLLGLDNFDILFISEHDLGASCPSSLKAHTHFRGCHRCELQSGLSAPVVLFMQLYSLSSFAVALNITEQQVCHNDNPLHRSSLLR
jgi:hypothetical protein